jgi:hypothetical protein
MLGLTSFRANYMIFAGVEAHAYDKKKNRLIYGSGLFKIKNNSFINYLV